MDYTLKRAQTPPEPGSRARARIVPPRRPKNLLRGGGRRDSPGWTEHKRKSNRRRFDELRTFIQTAVTVCYPSRATPDQLARFNDRNRNFCKEHKLPARCVWEGPGFHQHIALGLPHDALLEAKWRARMGKHWERDFGEPLPAKAFLWKPDIEPDRIASYLSKSRKDGKMMVKQAYPWLTFCPAWETGFRAFFRLKKERRNGSPSCGKNSVTPPPTESPEKEHHVLSPRYTVVRPEKEHGRVLCPLCWSRWGRSLWLGSCKCNPAFPMC